MVSIWNSSKGARPQIRGPQCPVPKFQSRASWGEGDKGGARSPRGARKGSEAVRGSPHGCSAGGRRTHGWVLPGRPWLKVQGFGAGSRFCSVSPRVPPHRVRLPGGNVDRAGAGPQAPPPSGGLVGGSLRQKGGAASRSRRAPSAGGGYNVTLTTVLLFATFRSKIPLPAPTMPCALKGPRTPQGSGGWW